MIDIPHISELNVLHEGANSIVYKAYHQQLKKSIVLKVLKTDFPTAQGIARFYEEYEISKQLKTVKTRKAVSKLRHNNRYLLQLEYIEGQSLKEILLDQKQLTIDQFFTIAIQLTEALQELHEENVIHKDINPKNILITKNNQLQLIDLSISTNMRKQSVKLSNPNDLEGTLLYISPEQTGRMNRSIDHRSDLYSLGITFYEMLAGSPPFSAVDQIELIHRHIAFIPTALVQIRKDIPARLSDLVQKLMAKNAEDRYQSAASVVYDLKLLQEKIQSGNSNEVVLGTKDQTGYFQLQEKLYGREKELNTLLTTFDRVAVGALGCILLTGHSGVGKTALVHEIYKPITEKSGFFISGKFGQFQRDVPFSAIIHALKEFVGHLLAEEAQVLAVWKQRLQEVLGVNGQVLTEVIPSLELIIGPQADLPELGPVEAQNRFNLVFQDFIRHISQGEHPLVLFIDDWQWADTASIELFKLLMSDASNQFLLFIAAYRDNEVDISSPFYQAIQEVKKEELILSEITLTPLNKEDLGHLVADTLKISPNKCQLLSDSIWTKTQGNPFFTNQLFQALYEDGIIHFDTSTECWTWDLQQLNQSKYVTDDVITLMVTKIKRLSVTTQELLPLAACIGNEFNVWILAKLVGKPAHKVMEELRESMQEGLLIAVNETAKVSQELHEHGSFKFLHDRIQQAAYSLLSDQGIKSTNLTIGRLLKNHLYKQEQEQAICDVASYYNYGIHLITDSKEQLFLAQLNYQAGIKAKKSIAYQAAIHFFQRGLHLLDRLNASNKHTLRLDTIKELASCQYLATDFKAAEEHFNFLIEHEEDVLKKVRTLIMMSTLYATAYQYNKSLQSCFQALQLLEIDIQLDDAFLQNAFATEIQEIDRLTLLNKASNNIQELIHLDPLEDERMKALMEILVPMWAIAYMSNSFPLVFWTASKLVSSTLAHGVSPEAAFGLVAHGIYEANVAGHYHTGYELGRLAIQVNTTYNDPTLQTFIYHLMSTFLGFWKIPLESNYLYFDTAIQSGMQTGNYTYVGYAHAVRIRHAIMMGIPLKEFMIICQEAKHTLKQNKTFDILNMLACVEAFGKSLLQETNGNLSFDWEEFSERDFVDAYQKVPIALAVFYPLKTRLYYLHGQYEIANAASLQTESYIGTLFGTLWNVLHNVNSSLINAALCKPDQENTERLTQIKTNQQQLRIWADNCPSNFLHHYLTVEAELANVEQRYLDAMDFYDKAISTSQKYDFVQDEALANELAARFYLKIDKMHFAELYLKRAHYAYGLWEASAKQHQLVKEFPQLFDQQDHSLFKDTITASLTKSTGIHKTIDLKTFAKASQALSEEIHLAQLLKTMIRLVVENAGAEKGYFLLAKQEQLYVEAEICSTKEEIQVLHSIPIEQLSGRSDTPKIPNQLVNYVVRTKEVVLLDDATKEGNFMQLNYIKRIKPKSILCVPLLKRKVLVGILYLENNLATNAFTAERAEIIQIMAAQIAISIENARFYEELEAKVQERTTEVVAQKELIEKKNQDITASITYAQRIQHAVLPYRERISQFLPEHFILFLPRDIVSGDFYWFEERKGKIILAAADCTGHGVPGAFMSMLGSEALGHIVSALPIEQLRPDHILNKLHLVIRKALKQAQTHNRDGMDISICVIDPEQKTIDFAAARNPLVYIQDDQLHVIKGDRKSIGGKQKETTRVFMNHQVSYAQAPISMFMYSDGYQDQFGGDKGRKLMANRLQQVLLDHHQESMETQLEQLKDTFHTWRGSHRQIDDVLVMGVRLS